jgi:hypothetical protein
VVTLYDCHDLHFYGANRTSWVAESGDVFKSKKNRAMHGFFAKPLAHLGIS